MCRRNPKWYSTLSNDTLTAIRNTKTVINAMRRHKEVHPSCAWCYNNKQVEVHHIVPLWANTSLAADPNNFISLCKTCHLIVGHNRNFATKYIKNIKHLCAIRLITLRLKDP